MKEQEERIGPSLKKNICPQAIVKSLIAQGTKAENF